MDGQEWLCRLLGDVESVSPESQAMSKFRIVERGKYALEQESSEEIPPREQQENF